MLPFSITIEEMTRLINRIVNEVQKQCSWDEMDTLLVVCRKHEGHCNFPHLHIEDGTKLGS